LCEGAGYTSQKFYFICGPRTDECDHECTEATYYDYYEIECHCEVVPMCHVAIVREYQINGAAHSCKVCQ
jgi:hypothetical protein